MTADAAPPGWRRLLRLQRHFARTMLVSYAQVLFSTRPDAGLLFLTASFCASPRVGLVGLVAVGSANLAARFMWHDRIRWELGLAGYNAALLGLALGLALPHSSLTFLLAAAGGIAAAAAAEWLNRRFSRWSLPVLGIPFIVFAWLLLAFPEHGAPAAPVHPDLPMHGFTAETLKAFGAVFFSPTAMCGLLVLAGLVLTSRISAAVGLAGALVAAVTGLFRHPSISLSINLIVAPIGLAFFLAPNPRMPLQVLAGLLLTLGLSLALEPLFNTLRLPMLILPLTLTLFAFQLAARAKRSGVELVPMRMLRSAEVHLRVYQQRRRLELRLPFFGTWFVSQGADGGVTHKDGLGQAWDFMVRDERGRTFATPGYRLTDYHAFGLQVTAPANGRVAAVENGVPDNPPGKLNEEQNWGNYVVLEHGLAHYSVLAHLRQGSVRVKAGDRVPAGAVLGACGNSGYSAQPHLHFQLQSTPVLGSDTVPVHFANYLVAAGGRETFVHRGRPEQDEIVQPLLVQESTRQLLLASLGPADWRTGERRERWTAERRGSQAVLRSKGSRVVLVEERDGVRVKAVRGSGNNLLVRAFEGLVFLPFYSRPGLRFSNGAWQHDFGSRAALPDGTAALVLESRTKGAVRRIWFASRAVRVEWSRGATSVVAERT